MKQQRCCLLLLFYTQRCCFIYFPYFVLWISLWADGKEYFVFPITAIFPSEQFFHPYVLRYTDLMLVKLASSAFFSLSPFCSYRFFPLQKTPLRIIFQQTTDPEKTRCSGTANSPELYPTNNVLKKFEELGQKEGNGLIHVNWNRLRDALKSWGVGKKRR